MLAIDEYFAGWRRASHVVNGEERLVFYDIAIEVRSGCVDVMRSQGPLEGAPAVQRLDDEHRFFDDPRPPYGGQRLVSLCAHLAIASHPRDELVVSFGAIRKDVDTHERQGAFRGRGKHVEDRRSLAARLPFGPVDPIRSVLVADCASPLPP